MSLEEVPGASEQVADPEFAPRPLGNDQGAFSAAPPPFEKPEGDLAHSASAIEPPCYGPQVAYEGDAHSASPKASQGPSPSEWGGGLSPFDAHSMPPPPVSARENKKRSPFAVAIAILLAATCVLAGFFGIEWFMKNRTATYESSVSALNFNYPGSWEKIDTGELAGLAGITDVSSFNEVLIADSADSNMKCMMGAGSFKISPGDWETVKSTIGNEFTGDLSSVIPDTSVQVNNATVTEATVAGEDTICISLDTSLAEIETECSVFVFHKDSIVYMIMFMSQGDNTGNQVQEILDSVTLL